jgi:hypothetical protein
LEINQNPRAYLLHDVSSFAYFSIRLSLTPLLMHTEPAVFQPGDGGKQNEDLTPRLEDSFDEKKKERIAPCKIVSILCWTPPRCRWDAANPSQFNIWLNVLFAVAGTFTVANLYYAHPILDLLAQYFDVSHERISLIPTCCQAGYATGLIFLCPLGDLVRRRHFVLLLTFLTATLWLGLCLTSQFPVFLGLSFVTSVTTVTPVCLDPLPPSFWPY